MKRFVIAIDGPVGAGKSTVAKMVAKELNFLYVDTGAMYRAITLKAMKENIDFNDREKLIEIAKNCEIKLEMKNSDYFVYLDGEDVTNEIRKEEVSKNTHFPASIIEIREILWEKQRKLKEEHDIVMEGRDIGSKVFPDAQIKIYLDADVKERAKRRYLQLKEMGFDVKLEEIERELMERDERDKNRKIAPLVRLPDAYYIDSTNLNINEVVERILNIYRNYINSLKFLSNF